MSSLSNDHLSQYYWEHFQQHLYVQTETALTRRWTDQLKIGIQFPQQVDANLQIKFKLNSK
jgi:hypothetical protein